jgi:hypothetical protein
MSAIGSVKRRYSAKKRSVELDDSLEKSLMHALSVEVKDNDLMMINEVVEPPTPAARGKIQITCRALNTYNWLGSPPCCLIKMP